MLDQIQLNIRPLSPELDSPLIHQWVRLPYARYWRQSRMSLEDVRSHYELAASNPGRRVFLVWESDTGTPLGLFKTYAPESAGMGAIYPALPTDLGFHYLSAPKTTLRQDLGFAIIAAAFDEMFRQSSATRLIVEPHVGNTKMITRMLQMGFHPVRIFKAQHGFCYLMVLEKSIWEVTVNNARKNKRPPVRPELPLRIRWLQALISFKAVIRSRYFGTSLLGTQ